MCVIIYLQISSIPWKLNLSLPRHRKLLVFPFSTTNLDFLTPFLTPKKVFLLTRFSHPFDSTPVWSALRLHLYNFLGYDLTILANAYISPKIDNQIYPNLFSRSTCIVIHRCLHCMGATAYARNRLPNIRNLYFISFECSAISMSINWGYHIMFCSLWTSDVSMHLFCSDGCTYKILVWENLRQWGWKKYIQILLH
jgi:hypothetical protein